MPNTPDTTPLPRRFTPATLDPADPVGVGALYTQLAARPPVTAAIDRAESSAHRCPRATVAPKFHGEARGAVVSERRA